MVAPDICLAQAGMASKQLNGSSWCSARARAWLPQSLPSGNIISGTTKYLPLVPSYGLIRCSTFSPQHLYRCRLSTQLDPLKFNTPMSVHLCLQSVADPHSKGGGSDGVKAFFSETETFAETHTGRCQGTIRANTFRIRLRQDETDASFKCFWDMRHCKTYRPIAARHETSQDIKDY